jgi:hypothetical protein
MAVISTSAGWMGKWGRMGLPFRGALLPGGSLTLFRPLQKL